METHAVKVIARIRSDFPEKFGIPRQSGLVPELRAKVVFEPEFCSADALRGIEGFRTCGSSGSSPPLCAIRGRRPCARRALAATSASAFSPRVRRSAQTPSAFPA